MIGSYLARTSGESAVAAMVNSNFSVLPASQPAALHTLAAWLRVLLRRIFGGEGRTARFFSRAQIHQLEARAVGVIHVELALAVLAHLRASIVRFAEAIAGCEHLVGLEDRGLADRHMIHHPECALGDMGRIFRQQVLDPVV